jgi:hypothetical protein
MGWALGLDSVCRDAALSELALVGEPAKVTEGAPTPRPKATESPSSKIRCTPGGGDDVPYRLRPGVETTFLATPVRVNSRGFRGPECAITPRAHV